MPLWLSRLFSKAKGAISDPAGFLKDQLMLHAVDTLDLCLVCEVCWRPQRDGAYEVTTQSDFCAKVCAGPHAIRPGLRGISFDIASVREAKAHTVCVCMWHR